MYWAARSEPSELAARLIKQQSADVIRISDADSFLSDLADRVQAVADVQRQPPLAIDAAVATVKRFIGDASSVIRLNDLVISEAERAFELVGGDRLQNTTISADLVTSSVERADAATEVLRAMIACGTYWATEPLSLWVRALQRLLNRRPPPTVINEGFDLRFAPSLLVYYAAGIGAVAGGRYRTLRSLFLDTKIVEYEAEVPIVTRLYPGVVLQQPYGHLLPARTKVKTPMSDYLESALQGSLKQILVTGSEYREAFDRFEYLASLVFADQQLQKGRGGWAPVGAFGWRQGIMAKVEREISQQGVAWPAFGLFGGTSFDRLNAARAVVAELARPYGF
jgi:hypothetical protein